MDLRGKLVSNITIKSDGNLFHELLRYKPHKIAEICPEKVERVDLERGQWGTVGSVICWYYTIDGEKKIAREVIEAIDEHKKSITFTVMEGDLMHAYTTFKLVVDVDTSRDGEHVVTWTLVYEKKSQAVPDPHQLMNIGLDMSRDIERSHMRLVPN
ncbi:MLP-like protein 28 [Striga hermonthica]|uniref:MLP-like protein 28 n=1 Tax=Striga hermonthica TaxID=68872 RepID=A0A9N7MVD4_STRHE|nr:MLP-like protein 28 [Striga hermonthica]